MDLDRRDIFYLTMLTVAKII